MHQRELGLSWPGTSNHLYAGRVGPVAVPLTPLAQQLGGRLSSVDDHNRHNAKELRSRNLALPLCPCVPCLQWLLDRRGV